MDKNSQKLLISSICGAAVVGTTTFLCIYGGKCRKQRDEITKSLGNIDWASVPMNTRPVSKEIIEEISFIAERSTDLKQLKRIADLSANLNLEAAKDELMLLYVKLVSESTRMLDDQICALFSGGGVDYYLGRDAASRKYVKEIVDSFVVLRDSRKNRLKSMKEKKSTASPSEA